MNRRLALVAATLVLAAPVRALDAPPSSRADWLRDARLGVFVHLLPASAEDLVKLDDFDAEALAAQLENAGARYLVLTLGQNSGFFNAPNAAYDRRTGYRPGERCSRRDLPLALHRALQPRGIRLMLYLPCQTPNEDARAQEAFGLPQGAEGPADRRPLRPAVGGGHPRVVGALRRQGRRVVVRRRLRGRPLRRGDRRRLRGCGPARQSRGHRHLQPRREARPPHASRGLHGRGAERAVLDRAVVTVGRRLAVACAHVPRLALGLA